MNAILKKSKLCENIYMIEVSAPDIAKSARPGHFVMVQLGKTGERIPLSIADSGKKSVTIVFAAVGRTTRALAEMKKGSEILHMAGPLGKPSQIREFGKVCLIGGGFGAAPLYFIAKEMRKAKNRVSIIIGARTKKILFWEKELKKVCDSLVITTDDGSRGIKGFVTDALQGMMKKERYNLVMAIGPPIMMKSVCEMTGENVRTVVSLNPIMMDGIGMCGGCRVNVGGETKFACVDGPEFNGHDVDWNSLMLKNRAYREEEEHACRIRK